MVLGWRSDRIVRGPMIELILALVVTIAAFVILLDRKDRRHEKTVANLCQRLQAPEVAVIQHQIEQATDLPQPPTNDEEYWQQDEDRRQMIAQLEARENMPFDGAP